MVEIEVWTKESFTRGFLEDVYLGSCKLTYDQLKIGTGIKERFSLLRDNQVVGSILLARKYMPDEEPDYTDILIQSHKRSKAE